MSYTYLLEQGEESSADTFSDIPASVLSSGHHTRVGCCCNVSEMACYPDSRCGMMSRHLTERRGVAGWMSLRVASRVRTYPQRERVQASTAHVRECGDIWPASLARYDRDSCLWKTAQCSLLGGSVSFSEIWPRSGMMRNGVCWERVTPERHTVEIASGFLPTPTATANMLSPSMQKWPAHRRMWPTPVADSDRRTNYAQGGTSLGYAVRMWPTPTAQDAKNNGPPSQMERNTKPLNAEVGGALNPPWVEWLMGWPIGWTDLQPLETVKYRQWLRLHGAR